MKKYVKYMLPVLICLSTFFNSGCSYSQMDDNLSVERIDLARLSNADLKDSVYTNIGLIETYINERACNGDVPNANLYICKDLDHGDTLYVFEICDKAAWFAKAKVNENFAILKENIEKSIPDSVDIFVPKSFKIPNRSKFVFSTLTRLED